MYNNYRIKEIENKVGKIGFYPLDVMVTGATGTGKSSTLNAFFGRTVAEVGEGCEPETMDLGQYSLTENMRLWDTPGLGDGIARDEQHLKKIESLIMKKHHDRYYFLDMAIVIADAGTRDIGTLLRLIERILRAGFPPDRLLVVLNQADLAMKGKHWDEENASPDKTLEKFLEDKAISMQDRIYESTGLNIIKPVYYSAKYNYNIDRLYDMIIDNIPEAPRTVSGRSRRIS